MSKISELSDGGVIQGGDTLIAVRSGGNVKVTYGGSTTANIDGGTIDGTVIGGSSAAAGSFTTLGATGDVSISDKIVHSGDTNTALRFPAADTVTVETAGTERMRIDASGNVGIGVTPSAWGTNYAALQSVLGLALWTTRNTSATILGSNAYNANEASDRYVTSYWASKYTQKEGIHSWFTAPSGTAGNAISYSESMRIDASGNLLVGKTTTDFGTQGIRLEGSNGKIEITRNNNLPFALNRLTSDGDLINFYKDGATVGSIGVMSGNNLRIGGSVADHSGFEFGTNRISPQIESGVSDGIVDLGYETQRFKNLYLSGGVYLGGTGAANLLDDYEEGTWTPVLSDGTNNATASTAVGTYTKIGRMVHVKGTLIISSLGSIAGSLLFITGLPFTTSSAANTSASANFGYGQGLNLPVGTSLAGYLNTGNTRIVVQSWDAVAGTTNTTPAEWSADGGAYFDATYYI